MRRFDFERIEKWKKCFLDFFNVLIVEISYDSATQWGEPLSILSCFINFKIIYTNHATEIENLKTKWEFQNFFLLSFLDITDILQEKNEYVQMYLDFRLHVSTSSIM